MSFTRKVWRNICKQGLKMKGFQRPNKLKYHRLHGTKIEKYANLYFEDMHLQKHRGRR